VEAELTVYFYKRLDGIYGAKFRSLFKTEEQLLNSQDEWKRRIGELSQESIDQGMELLKDRIGTDNNFKWPDIAMTINLCKPQTRRFGNALKLANKHIQTEKADPKVIGEILAEVRRRTALNKKENEKDSEKEIQMPPPNLEQAEKEQKLINEVITRRNKRK
jgi:hypothetical protein